MFADHSGYMTMTGNTFLGAGLGAENLFKATASQLYTVTGNNAVTLAGLCIDTAASWNAVITGNSCQGVTDPGIAVGATSMVSGNIVNGRNELVGPGSGVALVKGSQAVSGGFLSLSANVNLVAAGSGQSDAASVSANQVFVSSVAAGSGIRLPLTTSLASGSATTVEVWNNGVNPMLFYPSSGEAIVGNAANTPISVPKGGQERCWWPGLGTAWVCSGATNLVPLATLASPTFSGTVTIPPGASIAGYAPSASPTLTGTPTAPTAASGNNTTQLATTGFVAAALPPVTSPAFQVVSASATFVPAAGSTWVRFRLFGPGGNGGAGLTCASGASCSGGGGGGAGGMTDFWVPAARIQSGGCTVTVGAPSSSNTVVTCNTGLLKTAYRGGGGANAAASTAAGGGGGDISAGGNGSGAATGSSNTFPNTGNAGTPLSVSAGAASGSTGSCSRGSDNNLGPTGGGSGSGLNAGAAMGTTNCGGGENPMSASQAPTIPDAGCEPNAGGASGIASTSAAAIAGGAGGVPGGGGGGGGSGTVSGGPGGAGSAGRVCIWQG